MKKNPKVHDFVRDSYISNYNAFGFSSWSMWSVDPLTVKARYNKGSYTVQVQNHRPQLSEQGIIYTIKNKDSKASIWFERPAK